MKVKLSAFQKNILVWLLFFAIFFIVYHGFEKNYFFSDDFSWLSRAILIPENPADLIAVRGRDFNPIFLLLLVSITKIFGISPLAVRLLALVIMASLFFMFHHVLREVFRVDFLPSLLAVLFFGLNVYLSESFLFLAALVYPLALLLCFVSILKIRQNKKWQFLIFFFLAFLVKESIIFFSLPIFFLSGNRKSRWWVAINGVALVFFRWLLQFKSTAAYSGFIHPALFSWKMYFILVMSLNLPVMQIPYYLGLCLASVFIALSFYVLKKREGFHFFILSLAVYLVFFSLLPKISSRYYLFPAAAIFGIVALLFDVLLKKNKRWLFAIISIGLVSLAFNYRSIRHEINDYRYLGDFTKGFIENQRKVFFQAAGPFESSIQIIVPKGKVDDLLSLYRTIAQRNHMLKLLPMRKNSIEGVMKPEEMVPILYFPQRIVTWKTFRETPDLFYGRLRSIH